MRIISGNWKGRRLQTVRGYQTRPTSDKVKGAIFNVLGKKVTEARLLDLFAGTGNLSWEALSRGAQGAVLVEKDKEAWKTAVENCKILKAEDKAKILLLDAFAYLERHPQEKFDLIFIDPPYRQEIVNKVLSYLAKNSLLEPRGVIIAETASAENIIVAEPLEIVLIKEYGDTKVWFIQEAEKKLGEE